MPSPNYREVDVIANIAVEGQTLKNHKKEILCESRTLGPTTE